MEAETKVIIIWDIEARGEATEHYAVEAATKEEAEERFKNGTVGAPWHSEVNGSEIVSIKERNLNG